LEEKVIKRKILPLGLITGVAAGLLLSGCSLVAPDQSSSNEPFNWQAVAMVAVLILLFYFFIIRPQNKRRKDQQKLVDSLKAGDQVVTAAGIYGEIESISQDSVVIKVESGAKLRVMKQGLMIRRTPEQMTNFK
jgi:preprotein translocase subunit YajC